MRIAWVSSWLPRQCGIATYSLDLVTALRHLGHDVQVVCHTDGGQPGEKDVHPVIPIKPGTIEIDKPEWCEILYKELEKINPEVVHIQHEYGLYTYHNDYSSGLLRTLFVWRVNHEAPVVITYHSVYTTLSKSERLFMDISLNLASAGIVHEEYQRIYLPHNIGRVPRNVFVVHHGGKELHPYPQAKTDLGLDGQKVVGMIGWWEPNKGFDKVIRLWPEILKRGRKDHLMLVVAGDARPGSVSGLEYKPKILEAVEKSPAKNNIKLVIGSFDPESYDKILSAFDIVVLPYTHASQSGNLAHAFALGIPAVVSGIEGLKYAIEESRAGIAVTVDDDLSLTQAIVALATDEGLRSGLAKNAKRFIESEIKWSLIAAKHVKIYQMLQPTPQRLRDRDALL